MKAVRLGARAALVDGRLVPGDVEVSGGRVVAVGRAPAGSGTLAVPGLVDLQVNGVAGVDLLAAGPDGYRRAGEALLAQGVTAYQPTLITAPVEATLAALHEAAAARHARSGGSRIVGVHLEGPFLSPHRLGTHPAPHRRDPDPALLDRLLGAGPVTTVTLAPELPGALGLVDTLVARGAVVSLGHSDATAQEAHAGFDRGASTVTHLFNAMRPFSARDPGIMAAALGRPEVVVQLIVDGHHLAADTVRLAWQAAAGRLALVTDAIAAAGVGDARVRLGEVDVTVRDGVARRADGTLAGSTLSLLTAVRNLAALGVPVEAALDAATRVPARVLRRPDLGRLAPGAQADVLLLDDRLEPAGVLLDGRAA